MAKRKLISRVFLRRIFSKDPGRNKMNFNDISVSSNGKVSYFPFLPKSSHTNFCISQGLLDPSFVINLREFESDE